jgi:hypothetical protein
MYQLINFEKSLFLQTKKARFRFKGKAHKILKLFAVAVWSVKNQRKKMTTPAIPVTNNRLKSNHLLLLLFL